MRIFRDYDLSDFLIGLFGSIIVVFIVIGFIKTF